MLSLLLGLLICCKNNSSAGKISTPKTAHNKEDSAEMVCSIEDGIHAAAVDYYNPETGYSKTYTLDVEVQNCEVIQINFPNGGCLDNDHLSPEELNEDGESVVEGENVKTYSIQIKI